MTSEEAVVCVYTLPSRHFLGPYLYHYSTQTTHYPKCLAMISRYGDLLKVYVKQINKGTLMPREDYIICALYVH